MSRSSARLLYWSPRILTAAFALFLSLFALDVFDEAEVRGWWATLAAFALHLIPAAIVAAGLLLAWRWEWVGALVFAALGTSYAWSVLPRHRDWALILGTPLLLIAALFLTDWVKRTTIKSAL